VTQAPGRDPAQGWDRFAAQWHRACATDSELLLLSTGSTTVFRVDCADGTATFTFEGGRLTPPSTVSSPDFTVRAPAGAWERFWEREPAPFYQSLFSMLARVPGVAVTGDQLRFAQHASTVRRVLEVGREVRAASSPDRGSLVPGAAEDTLPAQEEPIVGHYRRLTIAGERARIYYEEAGLGRDLVLLHTAGSDSRQFYHLMNDPRLLGRCHMVAFDLPWHGRSLPPAGALPGSYTLTTGYYAEAVEALAGALGLRQPLVLGCSMGGEICLELAHRSPGRFGGVIACEASDHVTGRQIRWSKDPQVSQALFVPEWVYGLMAPQSPERFRREVWWEYSQSGFGTYHGDIDFYSGDWDARDRVGGIDTGQCPVFMLTGEYDYSCTPEMSRRTAGKIPGARFRVMPGLGHFPMAENPAAFTRQLIPVLDELDRLAAPIASSPGGAD
jgi:pimeloyl-ACP methyl ester carboxylesterase